MIKRLLMYGLLMTLASGWLPGGYADATAAPAFTLSAAKVSPRLNEQFQMLVTAAGLQDLYGYELNLAYDAAKLKVVKVDVKRSGLAIMPIVQDGTIKLAQTQVGHKPGHSGKAVLAVVTFQAITTGASAIKLTDATLVNSRLEAAAVEPNGKLTVNVKTGKSGAN